MARIVHFEIPADDPERAAAFYGKAFGWAVANWAGEDYWLCTTGPDSEPGIDGALTRRSPDAPGFGLTIGVTSLDEAVAAVEAAGGQVVQRRSPIPGIGWLGVFVDTEGNTLTLIEADPAAA